MSRIYGSEKVFYPFGVTETLLSEGIAAGRGWALVKIEYDDGWYYKQWVNYSLRVNASEWWQSYRKCFSQARDAARKILSARPAGGVVKNVNMENCSPTPWRDGYAHGFWLETTVFSYKSEADRLAKVLKTGRDWDSVDYGRLAASLCESLKPVFDMFAANGEPVGPDRDDF